MTSWQIPTQAFQWKQEIIAVPQGFSDEPQNWIEKQASALGSSVYLLLFADDGVIWGEIRAEKLITSDAILGDVPCAAPPQISSQTLQQAYLFGEKGELRIWRDGKDFLAARIVDTPGGTTEAFDQDQILFGTAIAGQSPNQFTLVEDGRQGLRHAVPLDLKSNHFNPGKLHRPLRLKVRYYLSHDDEGQVYITASRLVRLFAVKGGK